MVAHAMSVIAVQSGVGAHVASTQPEEAAKALSAIEATSRAALEELRRLLGVLRQDSEPQGDLTPVPGLADLDSLLAEVSRRALGCGCGWRGPVAAARRGGPVGLPDRAGGADQRGQARRPGTRPGHGRLPRPEGDARGHRRRSGVGALAGDGRAGVGHGLIGMRERVAAFDGDLDAGPRPGRGFRVAARLPLAERR